MKNEETVANKNMKNIDYRNLLKKCMSQDCGFTIMYGGKGPIKTWEEDFGLSSDEIKAVEEIHQELKAEGNENQTPLSERRK